MSSLSLFDQPCFHSILWGFFLDQFCFAIGETYNKESSENFQTMREALK